MDLRLEGFDGGIRGYRSLVIGKESDWLGRIHQLESEALYKGRSILVIHEANRSTLLLAPSLLRKRWDCVFRIRDSFEAQMLATYVANAPKPVRILWTSQGQDIPRALWQRWEKSDITLLGGSNGETILGCEWDAIFFPLNSSFQNIERILSMRGSGLKFVASHLAEIAANGAALLWSKIQEDVRGSLYWYDPSEYTHKSDLTKEEASKMLEDVIQMLH